MKKKLFLLSIIFIGAFFSCGGDDESIENNPDNTKVVDEIDFDFTKKIRNNIQVGEMIPLTVDFVEDISHTDNTVYKLVPLGTDETKHQVLYDDYNFLIKKKIKVKGTLGIIGKHYNTVYHNIRFLEIKDPEDIQKVYIQPKKPGTYQLEFSLQKYDTIAKKHIGKPIIKSFTFNVVKINFRFPEKRTRKPSKGFLGIGSHSSKHERRWKVAIDDGNRAYDTYLSNKASTKEYRYSTNYDGQTKKGVFHVDTEYDFKSPIETKTNPVKIRDYPQKMDITITQFFKDGTKNIIEYKKVSVY